VSWLVTNTLAALLLPPLSLFLLGGFGWWLLRRRHARTGKSLMIAAAVLLWLLSTPLVSSQMMAWLETQIYPVSSCEPQAIVALGAGTRFNAPEYGGADTVSVFALERLRYAAYLQRQTRLPILVSGGSPDGGKSSEAALMKSVLESDFRATVKWVEGTAHNTRESAVFTRQLLQRDNIGAAYLVTHASHMPRALGVFARTGLCVLAAPTGKGESAITVLSFLPSAVALNQSHTVLHEWIGMAWYRLMA
jgi:uncharacterized SAM-binding protein YcdF (DUF218 family)